MNAPYAFAIGCLGVEVVLHVILGQLTKSSRIETEELEQFVEFRDVDR